MPPVPSPGSHDSQAPRLTAVDRAARVRFRRAMALMLMTLVLPGSAQIVAGNRRVGLTALYIWVAGWAVFLGTLLVGVLWHELFFWFASTPFFLFWLRLVLMALATGWALLFFDALPVRPPLPLSLGTPR